jgi:hypothetical protein
VAVKPPPPSLIVTMSFNLMAAFTFPFA